MNLGASPCFSECLSIFYNAIIGADPGAQRSIIQVEHPSLHAQSNTPALLSLASSLWSKESLIILHEVEQFQQERFQEHSTLEICKASTGFPQFM